MAIPNMPEHIQRFSRLNKAFAGTVGARLDATGDVLFDPLAATFSRVQQMPLTPSQIAQFYEREFADQAGNYENAFEAFRKWEASYYEALNRSSVTQSRIASMRHSGNIDLTLLPAQDARTLHDNFLKDVLRLDKLIKENEIAGGFGLPGINLQSQNDYRDVFKFLVSRRNLTAEGTASATTTVEHPFQIFLEKGTFSFNPGETGLESLTFTPKSAIPSSTSLQRIMNLNQQADQFGGAPRPFGNLEVGKKILVMDIETSGLSSGSDVLGIAGSEMESYLSDDGRVLLRPPTAVEDISATFTGPQTAHMRGVVGGEKMSFTELMASIRGQSIDDVINFDEDFLARTNSILEKMLEYDHISGYNINRFDIPRLLDARARHIGYGVGEIGAQAKEINAKFAEKISTGNYVVDLMDTIVPYIEDQANQIADVHNYNGVVDRISQRFTNAVYPAEVLADIQTGGTSGYRSMNSLLLNTNFAELIERDGTHANILYDALQRGTHLEDVDAHLEAFFAHYVQNGELKLWPLAEQGGQQKTVLGEAFRARIARSRPITVTTNIADINHLHDQIYQNIITQNADTDKVVLSINRQLLEAADPSLGSDAIDELIGEGSGILSKRNGRFVVSTGAKETEIGQDTARNIIRNIVTAAKEGDEAALAGRLSNYAVTLPNGTVINTAADSIRSLGVTYGQQSSAIEIMENAVQIARRSGLPERELVVPSSAQIEHTASGVRILENGQIIKEITGDVQITPRGTISGTEYVIKYTESAIGGIGSPTEENVIKALTLTTEQAPVRRQSFLQRLLGRQAERPAISATGYTPGFSAEMTTRFADIEDPLAFAPPKNRIIGEMLAKETAAGVENSVRAVAKTASNLHAQYSNELISLGNYSFKEVERASLIRGLIAQDAANAPTTSRAFVPQRILQQAAQELVDEGKLSAEELIKYRGLSIVDLGETKYINAFWDVGKLSAENNQITIDLAEKLFDTFSDRSKLYKALGIDEHAGNLSYLEEIFGSEQFASVRRQHENILALTANASDRDAAIKQIAQFIENGIVESSLEQTGSTGQVTNIINHLIEQGVNYQHDVPLEEFLGTSRLLETDLPTEAVPGGKLVTYSMPLDEEAVRIAGQTDALNAATEVIVDKNGKRISRIIASANATAERLRGKGVERLRAAKMTAERNAPVEYTDTVIAPPIATNAPAQNIMPMDMPEGYMPFDAASDAPMDLPIDYVPIDAASDAPMNLPDDYIPIDASTGEAIDLINDAAPIDAELDDLRAIGSDIPMNTVDASSENIIDDLADIIDTHFENINPGENNLLKGYRAIKPKLGITLTAAAISGTGYYLYKKYEKNKIFDETLENQPFEKPRKKYMTGAKDIAFGSNNSDPLKTAGVVGNLDRGKIGHYKMGNKKYNHLYGGQL